MEVDRGVETFSILIEDNIRVKPTGISSIPQTISFKQNHWISIHLIPIFIVEDPSHFERNGKKIQTDGNSELVQKPKNKKNKSSHQGRIPNPSHHPQHHYCINKKVTWAP